MDIPKIYMKVIIDYIHSKITNISGSDLRGYSNERDYVLSILKRCVEDKESNTALIIGPPGSGKNTLVNNVLNELQQSNGFNEKATIIELNGLLHTDDRIALKDITRQMNLEEAVGGKSFMSFADNLSFLLKCLKSKEKDNKTVIYILDEFDLFCSHRNQTLLYNLFDVAHSAEFPVCVLGLTRRLDVIELLEKRVKSRFSHRQIILSSPADGKSNFATRMADLVDLLSVDESKISMTIKELQQEYPKLVKYYKDIKFDPTYIRTWNEHIEHIVSSDEVKKVMKSMYDTDRTERSFRTFLIQVIANLLIKYPALHPSHFTVIHKSRSRDTMSNILLGLSVMEMCLVISMKHHVDIYDDDPLNFEMIVTRYLKFAKRNLCAEMVERPVLFKAFEHLEHLQVIVPVTGTSKNVRKECQLYTFQPFPEQVNSAVKAYSGLPTSIEQWNKSSYQ